MRFVAGVVQAIERFTEEFVDSVQEAAENVGNFFVGAFKAPWKCRCVRCVQHTTKNCAWKLSRTDLHMFLGKNRPNGFTGGLPHMILAQSHWHYRQVKNGSWASWKKSWHNWLTQVKAGHFDTLEQWHEWSLEQSGKSALKNPCQPLQVSLYILTINRFWRSNKGGNGPERLYRHDVQLGFKRRLSRRHYGRQFDRVASRPNCSIL